MVLFLGSLILYQINNTGISNHIISYHFFVSIQPSRPCLIAMVGFGNLVTPKAAAEPELLLNKQASDLYHRDRSIHIQGAWVIQVLAC